MKEKIVLIGAGSAEFTRGLVADVIRSGVPTDLALVDIDPAALDTAERLVAKMIAAKQAPVALSAATDRRGSRSGRRRQTRLRDAPAGGAAPAAPPPGGASPRG